MSQTCTKIVDESFVLPPEEWQKNGPLTYVPFALMNEYNQLQLSVLVGKLQVSTKKLALCNYCFWMQSWIEADTLPTVCILGAGVFSFMTSSSMTIGLFFQLPMQHQHGF